MYQLPWSILKFSIVMILLICNGSSEILSSNLKRHNPSVTKTKSLGTESTSIILKTKPTVPIILSA